MQVRWVSGRPSRSPSICTVTGTPLSARTRGPATGAPAPARVRPAWPAASPSPGRELRESSLHSAGGLHPGAREACRRNVMSDSRLPSSMVMAESIWPTASCSSRDNDLRSSSWVRTKFRESRRSSSSARSARPRWRSLRRSRMATRDALMTATSRPRASARRTVLRRKALKQRLAPLKPLLLPPQVLGVDIADFPRQSHDRLAPREHLLPKKRPAEYQFLLGRPRQDRIHRFPIRAEFGSQPQEACRVFRIHEPLRRRSSRCRIEERLVNSCSLYAGAVMCDRSRR